MVRLNEKDLSLLSDGKTASLLGAGYAYLGGNFTTNPNDYVQISIYDTNDNFLESAIVGSDDYIYNAGEVKLKTGTILRRMGYDRGRYVVKYNFFRKLAGSYENILVDENNNRYFGDYSFNEETGEITDVNGNRIYLKEYKYFTHKISPSRKEIRLVPQRINDKQYIDDFFNLQTELKKVDGDGEIKFAGDDGGKADSLTMEYVDSDKSFPSQLANGYIVLNNVFSQPLNAPADTNTTEPDIPIAPTGNPLGVLPEGNLNPGSSVVLNSWTWYFYYLDQDGDTEGYFKDSDDNGWEYEGSNNNQNRSFTYIPADEYPPDF
jgi:hypothetical protein